MVSEEDWVSFATSVALLARRLVEEEIWEVVLEISAVVTLCSSTAAAMFWEMSLILEMTLDIVSMALIDD